jgi:hypothetical protein
MLLIGLVMGLLLQTMNLKNRELVIDSLESRIRMLEIRIWLETGYSDYRPKRGNNLEPNDSRIRGAGDGTNGFLVCESNQGNTG